MLIEVYKGIKITHDAFKDEFVTEVVLNKNGNGKNEYLRAGRLQKVRDELDKFLNTAAKKPVIKKAWLRDSRGETYSPVTVVVFNGITGSIMVLDKEGKSKTLKPDSHYSDEKAFISCKENDAIVAVLNKKQDEIQKIKKEISCMSGKLIPVKSEHFV